jgi:hypothetical protein
MHYFTDIALRAPWLGGRGPIPLVLGLFVILSDLYAILQGECCLLLRVPRRASDDCLLLCWANDRQGGQQDAFALQQSVYSGRT